MKYESFTVLAVGHSEVQHLRGALEPAGRRYRLKLRQLGTDGLPQEAIDRGRGQVRADALLGHFARTERLPEGALGLLLTDLDIFASVYAFLFGLADRRLGWAVVSTYRLRDPSPPVFEARVEKEVVHEMGHLMELAHCPTAACVMSFSNRLAEVDAKNADLCPRCLSIVSSDG